MRPAIRYTRSTLYRTARILGDAQAVLGGGAAIAKRLARRAVGRVLGLFMRGLFR